MVDCAMMRAYSDGTVLAMLLGDGFRKELASALESVLRQHSFALTCEIVGMQAEKNRMLDFLPTDWEEQRWAKRMSSNG